MTERVESNFKTKTNPAGYYKWDLARKESPEAGSMSDGNKNSIRNVTDRAGWQMMSLATRELGPSVTATLAKPCVMTAL